MIRQIVVLAGGLATRLYPITKTIAKSMVPIAGEPFLAHQLRLFQRNGIEEVVLCVGHFADQIIDTFGNGRERFDLSIVYSKEKEKMDTGGALKYALPALDYSFFVIYGDSYLLQDYQEVATFFEQQKKLGLMCVYRNENQIEPSRVTLDGPYVKLYRKDPPPPGAHHMEYGLNIFRRSVIPEIPKTTFPISEYFDTLSRKRELVAFEVQQRFYEMGSPEGLTEIHRLLKDHDQRS